MRVLVVVLVVLVVVASCSKKPGPSGIMPRSGGPPGAITLRFVNSTGAAVFVGRGTGMQFGIENKDGLRLSGPRFCQDICGKDCQCNQCGSPMETSDTIAPGAVLELKWDGAFYEEGRCEKGGDRGCGCAEQRFAEDGAYTITSSGARAVNKDNQIDPASAKCTAKGTVNLRAGAQTVDIPFTCSP